MTPAPTSTPPTSTAAPSVVALHVHPVKSLAGVSVDAWPVDARGLVGDRHWAVVDPAGDKVTAREARAMLGLRAVPLGDRAGAGIRVTDLTGDDDGDPLEVAAPVDGEPVAVGFSGMPVARAAGAVTDEWLTRRLGRPVRLVWQGEEHERPVRPEYGGRDGDRNSLSDAAPVHVTTEASLARLNDWVLEGAMQRGEPAPDPLGHDRFRPNVVVAGGAPFAEDAWGVVSVGGLAFRTTMVTDRCVMTTVDRDTLEGSKEPIRTLARHRRWEGATWFGVRLTPVLPVPDGAVLRVGDPVVG
jgi:uncharacterized protein YcbX